MQVHPQLNAFQRLQAVHHCSRGYHPKRREGALDRESCRTVRQRDWPSYGADETTPLLRYVLLVLLRWGLKGFAISCDLRAAGDALEWVLVTRRLCALSCEIAGRHCDDLGYENGREAGSGEHAGEGGGGSSCAAGQRTDGWVCTERWW